MSSYDLKPKEDRVKESITILNKLKELGIKDIEPGYQRVKELMSEWVKTGESVTETVEFPYFGRKADLVLPKRADRTASLLLKAPPKHLRKN
jgi:hypothetical protein